MNGTTAPRPTAILEPSGVLARAVFCAVLVLLISGCVPATTTVTVKNDTRHDVELSLCDDDPVAVSTGQTVQVHPLANAKYPSCFVSILDGPISVGCLRLAGAHQPVLTSSADPKVTAKDCGSY